MKRRSSSIGGLDHRFSRMNRRVDAPRANKRLLPIIEFFRIHLPDVQVTENTLTMPSSEDVRRVYPAMLLFAGICTSNDLFLDNNDNLNEEEAAKNGTALFDEMSFFVNKFTDGQSHFSLTDLATPDSARFLRFLQDMIKFYNVRIERQNDLTGLFQERDEIMKRQVEAPILLEALKNEEIQLLATLDKNRRKKIEHAYQLDELKKKEVEMKKEINDLDERIPKEEFEISEENKRLEAVRERLGQLNEEITELRGKMIQSPDRQKAELKRQERDLEDLNTKIQMNEASIDRFEKHIHQLEQVDHHYANFMESFQHVKQEFQTLEGANCRSTSLQTQLEKERIKSKKFEDEAKRMRKNYEAQKHDEAMKQERMTNEIQQYDGLIGQLNERKEELEVRLSKTEAAIQTTTGQVEALKQVVKEYNVEGTLKNAEEQKNQLEKKTIELLDQKASLLEDLRKLDKIYTTTQEKLEQAIETHRKHVTHHKAMVEEATKPRPGFRIIKE